MGRPRRRAVPGRPRRRSDAKKPADANPDPAPPAPRKPGPDDAQATAVLGTIVTGPDAAARKAAIDELAFAIEPRL